MNKILSIVPVIALLALPFTSMAATTITLTGGSVTVPQGHSYVEPGYSAFSTNLGDVTAGVSSTGVDTSHSGVYSVGYSYGPDGFSDTASASRDVTVVSVGGGPAFCTGPLAPGWNVSLPHGGCPVPPVAFGDVPHTGTLIHNADGSYSLIETK